MAEAGVTWVQGEQFVATGTGGHGIVLDAPGGRDTWQGFKPSELLLAALAGCTAVDVIDILRKKRQRVSARGEQRTEHPKAFERIAVHYEVRGQGISATAVERAIRLSEEKYCSVAATVRGVATITTSYTICRGWCRRTRSGRGREHGWVGGTSWWRRPGQTRVRPHRPFGGTMPWSSRRIRTTQRCAGAAQTRECLAQAYAGDPRREQGQRGHREDRRRDAGYVGDDAGEERAHRVAEVAPEAVHAHRRGPP
jgi:putative redox protein